MAEGIHGHHPVAAGGELARQGRLHLQGEEQPRKQDGRARPLTVGRVGPSLSVEPEMGHRRRQHSRRASAIHALLGWPARGRSAGSGREDELGTRSPHLRNLSGGRLTSRKLPRSLAGRIVAITGGARGIGRATATALIAQGTRVAIGDIDAPLAAQTASELGSGTIGLPLDVTDRASFDAFLTEVERQLGPLDGGWSL